MSSANTNDVSSLERLELVYDGESQRSFADAVGALATYAGLSLARTELAGDAMREYAGKLRVGAFYPCLFDNDEQIEIAQPLAIISYVASLGKVPGATSATVADAVHANSAAEAVLRFLREGVATTTRTTAVAHIAALQGILSQVPVSAPLTVSASSANPTFGDVLVFLYLSRVTDVHGVDTLGPLRSMYDSFFDATDSARARLVAYTTATSTRTPQSLSSKIVALGGGPIVVTGAGGFIGSWIVRLLLERGYTVHGTVRSISAAPAHLTSLPGASERLRLFEADLLAPSAAFAPAMEGAVAVCHSASPFFHAVADPQAELIDPAVQGTRSVLHAAIASSTVRVAVVTSSAAAVYVGGPSKPVDAYYDESCWSDAEYLRATKQYYALSKVLAEKEAWRVAEVRRAAQTACA